MDPDRTGKPETAAPDAHTSAAGDGCGCADCPGTSCENMREGGDWLEGRLGGGGGGGPCA